MDVENYLKLINVESLLSQHRVDEALRAVTAWVSPLQNLALLPWTFEDPVHSELGSFSSVVVAMRPEERIYNGSPFVLALRAVAASMKATSTRDPALVDLASKSIQWLGSSDTSLTLAHRIASREAGGRAAQIVDSEMSRVDLSSASEIRGVTYMPSQALWSEETSTPRSVPLAVACENRAPDLSGAIDLEVDRHGDFPAYVYETPESPFSWLWNVPAGVPSAETELATKFPMSRPLAIADAADLTAAPHKGTVIAIVSLGHQTFRLTGNPSGVSFEVLPATTEDLVAAMRRVNHSMSVPTGSRVPASFDGARAAWLYQQLLGTALSPGKERQTLYVTIIGPLERVALNALVVSNAAASSASDLKSLAWLDSAFDVIVLPGLSKNLLKDHPTAPLPADDRSALLFGNPALSEPPQCASREPGRPSELCSVPLTGDLLVEISRTISGKNQSDCTESAAARPERSGIYCYWQRAFARQSMSRILESAIERDWSLVLVATHGLTDVESSRFSQFANSMVVSSDDTTNPLDGLILAGELDSVPLRTHWAILAMCNSGDESGGEGREAYSGLARSFLSAGAEAVTASRWEVDERATKVLISEVVREGILQGESPSRALALAMHKFRDRAASSDDPELANSPPTHDARRASQPPRPYLHPYYWAGFVSIAK